MNCASCGGEVAPTASFCPHCGQRTDNANPVPVEVNERPHAAVNRMRPGAPSGSGNQPNEEELWSGTYSPKAMVGPAVGLAILTIIALVVGFLVPPFGWIIAGGLALVAWAALGLVLLYRRMSVRYRLTTFRFFHETGILSRSRHRIEVIDINDVTLAQGLIERMFQVGTIRIQSSDVTHPNLYLPGIENVAQVTDLIDNTRRAERQRRGLFMENIGGIISS